MPGNAVHLGESVAPTHATGYESQMAQRGVNLTKNESDLMAQTQPAAMAALDADELVELHSRVRRARNKYVTLYRRRGAAKVSAKGSRGVAAEANERGWDKAEVFEDALARVSRQLAVAAQRSAREIKQERLAAARKETPVAAGAESTGKKQKAAPKGRDKPARKAPARQNFEASTKAAGARRQAKRDSR